MKKSTKTLLYLGLGGVAAYFLVKKSGRGLTGLGDVTADIKKLCALATAMNNLPTQPNAKKLLDATKDFAGNNKDNAAIKSLPCAAADPANANLVSNMAVQYYGSFMTSSLGVALYNLNDDLGKNEQDRNIPTIIDDGKALANIVLQCCQQYQATQGGAPSSTGPTNYPAPPTYPQAPEIIDEPPYSPVTMKPPKQKPSHIVYKTCPNGTIVSFPSTYTSAQRKAACAGNQKQTPASGQYLQPPSSNGSNGAQECYGPAGTITISDSIPCPSGYTEGPPASAPPTSASVSPGPSDYATYTCPNGSTVNVPAGTPQAQALSLCPAEVVNLPPDESTGAVVDVPPSEPPAYTPPATPPTAPSAPLAPVAQFFKCASGLQVSATSATQAASLCAQASMPGVCNGRGFTTPQQCADYLNSLIAARQTAVQTSEVSEASVPAYEAQTTQYQIQLENLQNSIDESPSVMNGLSGLGAGETMSNGTKIALAVGAGVLLWWMFRKKR
jgi:hypothetical protein